ncbi:MAG: imidazole glycerol phosphate synthase subunit HisH [Bacteroidia bacterium]|nr:imidazole glycerol phosphate synthase subunit HisH [Bacteroidia bacterium]
MKIVLINYGAGNIQSILFALERLNVQAVLSDDPEEIRSADLVIFPGVGEASSAMAKLQASSLDTLIETLKQPVLGICLGMQLMCNHSEEGNTKGLGIFDTSVLRFPENVKVPQIGWNTINELRSPLFNGIKEGSHVYTVHSYYAPLCKDTSAVSDYAEPYSAALQRDNFYGLQFHPEKSSAVGSKILSNFLNMVS